AANASDPDTGDSISKVEFYHDGLLLNTDTAAPYSFSWTGVPVGNYSIQAQAYDSKGASTLSAPVAIVVDPSTAPAVMVTSTVVTVPEGSTATFGVRLSAAPSASTTVTITKQSGGDPERSRSP